MRDFDHLGGHILLGNFMLQTIVSFITKIIIQRYYLLSESLSPTLSLLKLLLTSVETRCGSILLKLKADLLSWVFSM